MGKTAWAKKGSGLLRETVNLEGRPVSGSHYWFCTSCLFQFVEEILEARVISKNVVVGIVLDPVAFAPSFCEDALQQIECFFLLT